MNKNDPYTREDQTRFTMRIDTGLLDKIKTEAEKNKRSTAKQIEFILEEYISNLSTEWTQSNHAKDPLNYPRPAAAAPSALPAGGLLFAPVHFP